MELFENGTLVGSISERLYHGEYVHLGELWYRVSAIVHTPGQPTFAAVTISSDPTVIDPGLEVAGRFANAVDPV